MLRRKRKSQAGLKMSDKDSVDHPWSPRTPANSGIGKRRRRISDVIDSVGESSSGYSSSSPGSRFSSPYSSGSSPAAASTPGQQVAGTPASCAHGFVTPQRARPPHWHSAVSPDFGFATPERAGTFTPNYLLNKVQSPDALGNATGPLGSGYPFSSGEASGTMPVQKDADCYNMNHPSRGKCVIFNHEVFDTGFEMREGSSVDARRIEQTFQRLGFVVEICNDYEYSDIMRKVVELSFEDHTDRDCLCIFILTHGLKNDIICAKDVAYKAESVWKHFTAERCVTLAGKPKLFFFQACRGDGLDEGVRMYRSGGTETDSSVNSYKLPTHADFLMSYSTVDGFYSWRNPEEGTWYVQSLCDILDQHATTTDLARMLTLTARKVATDFASYNNLDPTLHGLKQVPTVTSSLIRELYFSPKNV